MANVDENVLLDCKNQNQESVRPQLFIIFKFCAPTSYMMVCNMIIHD